MPTRRWAPQSGGRSGKIRAAAVTEVITFADQNGDEGQTLTKNKMAELMQTGRAQLDRLLDPEQGNVMAWTQMPTAGLGRRNAGQAI
jgi:hypothetical protein